MRAYWKKTRVLLLALGALAFALMIYHIGPEEILQQILTLGFSLLLIFIPYLTSYLLDTLGWKATLGDQKEKISFISLFLVRTAGESVNYITPLAFVGGEPVKAYILRRFNIPLVQGLASVVISKTTMVIAQILFVLIGIILAVFSIEGSGPLLSTIFLLLLVGMVLIGLFLLAQKKGLFMGTLKLLEKIKIHIPFIKNREEKIRLLDQSISDFYNHDKKGFCYSIFFFLLGWFAGAFEVYLVLYFLGIPIDIPTAITIEALASIIKSSAFLIPGALGAQEGGNLLIFTVFGLAASTSLTFSLVRRLRELLLIGGGLAILAHYEVKVSSPLLKPEDKNKETSVVGVQ